MKHLTKLCFAATIACTSVAHAGGLAPAVQEQQIVIFDEPAPQSSAGKVIVPLILLGLLAAASGSSSTSIAPQPQPVDDNPV